METLERALREAADLAPDGLAVDETGWVDASWRRGRRQRTVRRASTAAGVLATLLVVAGLVLSTTVGVPRATLPADGGDGARRGVSSFPQRIGHQWLHSELPDRPGPVAGVVEVALAEGGGPGEWQAVMPSGTRYRLPGATPMLRSDAADAGATTVPDVPAAVSRDGRRIAWFSSGQNRLLVHDVVTGRRHAYETFSASPARRESQGEDGTTTLTPYVLEQQSPMNFSPSGDLLAVPTTRGTVVIGVGAGWTVLAAGLHQAAGWLDDDRLVGRARDTRPQAEQVAEGDPSVDLVVWNARTRRTVPLGTARLPQARPGTVRTLAGQWFGSVRADDTIWLSSFGPVPDGSAGADLAGYRLPSLEPVDLDGRPVPEPTVADLRGGSASAFTLQQWRGTTPLAGTGATEIDVTAVWAIGDRIITVEDSVQAMELVLARDAIDGSPTWSPFGTVDLKVLWWWRELALGALALVLWRWWVRRRRARPPAAAATRQPPAAS